MAQRELRLFLAFLLIAAWRSTVEAATVYVNPTTGNNANSGQDPAQAFKSLTYALTVVGPGSSIYLSEGVFTSDSGEAFTIFVPQAINIIGAGPNKSFLYNPTTLDTINFVSGSGQNSIQDMSIVGGFSGLTFAPSLYVDAIYHAKNLIIQRVLRTGILVRTKNTLIEDCLITQNGHVGIEYIPEFSGPLRIERCAAIGNYINGFSGGSFGPAGAITLRNNLIVGHSQFGALAGNEIGGTISNLTISRNGLPGIRLVDALPSQIVNCILHENVFGPIEASGDDAPEVISNLFYGPGAVADMNNLVDDPMFVGTDFGVATSGSITSLEYRPDDFKTIVTDASAEWADGQWAGAVLFPNIEDNTFAHSIVDNTRTSLIVWGDATDNAFAGAMETNRYEIIDYHLLETSPAIDAGTSSILELGDYDLEGRFRIASSEVDIGTFEFASIFPSPTPTPSSTPTQTPTLTRTPTFTRTQTFTRTPTATRTETWTPSQTLTPTFTQTPSSTPSTASTATPSETPTITDTRTVTPTFSATFTPTLSPTLTPDFDIAPDPPDNLVNAIDLLAWLNTLETKSIQPDLYLFGFSRAWMTAPTSTTATAE